MTRDERQDGLSDLWTRRHRKGGIAAVTGFGKTRTAVLCIQKSNPSSVIVVVPTLLLQGQWTAVLKSFKVKNFEVLVVNTACKLHLECDMLILDEVHTVGCADQFSLSWKNAKYNMLLWLTATIERRDGKHRELLRVAPIIDTVTFEEALLNNWVCDYTVYNVSVTLTPEERYSFDMLEAELIALYEDISDITSYSEEYVGKNMFKLAGRILGGDFPNKAKGLAAKYYKLIGKRKTILYNASEKIRRTIKYTINNPDAKILVFSQSQAFANKIQEGLGDICVTIHSDLKDKERDANLRKFKDGRTKKRVISSVKALNEGVDIPELDVGICAAGTSSKKDMIQMLGRVIRITDNPNKHALFFNLYVPGTQDLWWLKNRQNGLPLNKVQWVR